MFVCLLVGWLVGRSAGRWVGPLLSSTLHSTPPPLLPHLLPSSPHTHTPPHPTVSHPTKRTKPIPPLTQLPDTKNNEYTEDTARRTPQQKNKENVVPDIREGRQRDSLFFYHDPVQLPAPRVGREGKGREGRRVVGVVGGVCGWEEG